MEQTLEPNASTDHLLDTALLVLRCAALFLAVTFGRQKVLSLWNHVHSGQPLSAWAMTQFLRYFHFPAPALFAVLATLNESVVALLISAGLFTRLAGFIAASGMAVAFCISMKLDEEPLRALLYLSLFAAIAIIGPGRFSIDYLLKRGSASRTAESKS